MGRGLWALLGDELSIIAFEDLNKNSAYSSKLHEVSLLEISKMDRALGQSKFRTRLFGAWRAGYGYSFVEYEILRRCSI